MAKKSLKISEIQTVKMSSDRKNSKGEPITVTRNFELKHAEKTLGLCAKGLGNWKLVDTDLEYTKDGIRVRGDQGNTQEA